MPHVGVKRLCAGKCQHNGAHGNKHVPALCAQKGPGVPWVECSQDARLLHDFKHSGTCQNRKPKHNDRAKQLAHHIGAKTLHGKQAHQDGCTNGQYVGFEGRRDHFQPFHSTKHRDRRGDDTVAVEKGGTKDTNQQQHQALCWRGTCRFGGQCRQGHDAAFTTVVGPQDQQHVLQRDDHHQTPKNHRHGADQVHGIQRDLHRRAEDFLHGVQRAGADVTIHHTQSRQGEGGHAFAVGGICTRGRGHRNEGRQRGHVVRQELHRPRLSALPRQEGIRTRGSVPINPRQAGIPHRFL